MIKKVIIPILLALLVLTMLGCQTSGLNPGKAAQADQAQGTSSASDRSVGTVEAQTAVTAESQSQQQESSVNTAESGDGLTSAAASLENLKNLVPLHISVLTKRAEEGQTEKQISLEGDIDAKGNSHYLYGDGKGTTVEFYMVDGKEYIGTKANGFVEKEATEVGIEEALKTFGGVPWIYDLDDFSKAKKAGEETVNGFNTLKYEMTVNPISVGLSADDDEEGGSSGHRYTATVWIESDAKAIVKVNVDMSSSAGGNKSTFLNTLDVTKSGTANITAPKH